MSSPPTACITLHNLTVSYRRHPALHHVTGRFAAGSLTAVIGPNGAGKSTLLKTVCGLLPPDRPQGAVGSEPALGIDTALAHMAYLPQQHELDRSFPLNVQDCVLLGVWGACGAFFGVSAPLRQRAAAALQQVGLEGFEQRPIGTLSSGQLQRALFARLLVQDAPVILLDEPFSGIDSRTEAALIAMMLKWHQEGRTLIVVLHDDALVRQHFPQTVLLARECIAWGATDAVLTDANLRRARAMAEAWDETAAICDIDGTVNGLDFETLLAQRLAANSAAT